jgi:hypothetical protein
MASKTDLQDWVLEALRSAGGSAPLVEVCKRIWSSHEDDLRVSGDLFYRWQYDTRWAAHQLRRRGLLRPVASSPKGVWELS